jgi:hypothetical protein
MRADNSGISILAKILRNIVLILFLIIFVSIIYNFRNQESSTESALMANATSSTSFSGVFIRDEQIVTYSGSGVVSYSVSDGGKLGSGSVIAQVYDSDEQIKINREISKLTKELEVLSKIQNPGTVESAQPANLSSDIEETYRNLIYSSDTGDYDEISDEMDNFLIYLSTYQIVTNENVDFTARVTDINNQIAELQSSSSVPLETITADHSSYFVSYCDGYEDVLTKENIDSLTVNQLNEVTDSKQETSNVIGKLVDGYDWYIAGVIDNSKNLYNIGDTVKLKFESSSETYTGEILDLRDEGNPAETIIIVSCEDFTYDLVQHRRQNVEIIEGSYSGLKVPREAIRFLSMEETSVDEETDIKSTVVKNYKGVYIREGEQVEFRKIDVIYEGSDYVLSAVHNEDSSYLSLYDDIMIEGVDSDG